MILPREHPPKARDSVALQNLAGQPFVDRLARELREHCRGFAAER